MASSVALTEIVESFNISASTPSETVLPGGAAAFSFTVTPSGGASFPSAIALSFSGLPAGATATLSPATIAAGAGASNVTLTIQVPQTVAANRPARGRTLATFSLALLLLPFAGVFRRASRQLRRAAFVVLLLGAGLLAAAGISGCGTGSGFFGQAPQTYTVTLTGTSGNLTGSSAVSLTVE
jgi:hypothetical protein